MATTVVTSGVGGTDGVAPGTSGNLLTSDGTNWTSAAAAGGGAWTLINSTLITTNTAGIILTGIDTTYDTYAVVAAGIHTVTDNDVIFVRLRTSGADITSGYQYVNSDGIQLSGTTTSTARPWRIKGSDDYWRISGETDAVGNASGEGCSFVGYLQMPRGPELYPHFHGLGIAVNASTVPRDIQFHCTLNSAQTVAEIKLYSFSNNIAAGRFSLYGVSHA